MRSTLFHIPDTLFGLPMFGFGLLLAIWAVGSLVLLAWLIRKQGLSGDTLGYVPLLAVIGAVVYWIIPSLCEPEGLPIRAYGMMMLLGIVTGTILAVWRARAIGLDADTVITLVFWIVVPGIVGARLFYVIEYWREFWLLRPDGSVDLPQTVFGILNIAKGGLVVYGSFLGGMVGIVGFSVHRRISFLALADLIAPSMILGLALGRIGCFLNGCCFGGPCDLPWAATFPIGSPPFARQVEEGELYLHGLKLPQSPAARPEIMAVEPGSLAADAGVQNGQVVAAINDQPVRSTGDARAILFGIRDAHHTIELTTTDQARHAWEVPNPPPRSLPVQPAQVYSAIDAFILLLLLLAYSPMRRRDGELTAVMISVYPVSRFLMEIVRTDERAIFNTGMSISQNVSIGIFAAAIVLWIYLLRKPARRMWHACR